MNAVVIDGGQAGSATARLLSDCYSLAPPGMLACRVFQGWCPGAIGVSPYLCRQYSPNQASMEIINSGLDAACLYVGRIPGVNQARNLKGFSVAPRI